MRQLEKRLEKLNAFKRRCRQKLLHAVSVGLTALVLIVLLGMAGAGLDSEKQSAMNLPILQGGQQSSQSSVNAVANSNYQTAPQTPPVPEEKPASPKKMRVDPATIVDPSTLKSIIELVPKDAFTFFITGNWQAHLEPCGCADVQLGGIDRRTKILQMAPAPRRLLIEAGPLVAGSNHGQLQTQFKLEAFLRSLKELNYDSMAMPFKEMLTLSQDIALPPDEQPPLIATNMNADAWASYNVISHIQKTLTLNGATLECFVFSLNNPEEPVELGYGDGVQFGDPYEALQDKLFELELDPSRAHPGQAVIVTMSYENDELVEQLKELAAIDVIVHPGYADEPDLLNPPTGKDALLTRPLVVTTGLMGKYITCVAMKPNPSEQSKTLVYQFQRIPVEDRFLPDRRVVDILDAYQLQLQLENLIADENKLARQPIESGNQFIGSKSCGQADCHEELYQKWIDFEHANAMPTLIDVNRQYDPECVACHTVGMHFQTGYRSMDTTPELGAVGCEMCHGPGLKHLLDKYAPYQTIFTQCEQCHNHETSPTFDHERQEYFEKIKHWDDEPRRFWQ